MNGAKKRERDYDTRSYSMNNIIVLIIKIKDLQNHNADNDYNNTITILEE